MRLLEKKVIGNMAYIKTMTIDDYYTREEAARLYTVARHLGNFQDSGTGSELNNFNMVADNASELFTQVLKIPVTVDLDRSGVFVKPEGFTHFESFDSPRDWLFCVALDHTTFNIFEHTSGAKSALDAHEFNYRNLFEWDHKVCYQLDPGQGVFFRPWLFHSFISGMIQIFRLRENG
jgi:hypothetical protein